MLLATLFPLLNIILVVQAADQTITCSAGTFTIGEPASISCDFNTNVSAVDRGISVTKYPGDDTAGKIGEDVLLCSRSSNAHDCSVEMAGYTFDGTLTDHLTVRIPEVRFEHDGWYMCFFVPPQGTEAHACQLHVRARSQSASAGEAKEDLNLAILVPCVVGLLIVAVVVVVLCVRRRRMQRRRDEEESLPMIPMKCQTIEKHLEAFQLTKPALQKLVETMTQEIKKGLDDSTRQEADIKMFPTFVTHLPDGSERGDVLVLDFDGYRLQVSMVKLRGHDAKVKRDQYELPLDNKGDASNKLFYFVANSINSFLQFIKMPEDSLPLVFLVASPCDTARLAKGTNETTSEASVDQDLRNLLETALTERKKKKRLTPRQFDPLNKLKVVAVVNDSAGTLMSVADRKSNCRIGLTVGSGFKACFVEDCTHLETDSPEAEKKHEMIINTELGALGENGCVEFCRTEFDTDLDEQSNSPGTQILEKMVSWRYLGEMVRLVLEGLTRQSLLFRTVPLTCALFQKSSLNSEDVVKIEHDKEEPYHRTRQVLDKFGVQNFTDHDVENVRLICRYVCDRAAFLSAAGLATLINHVNQPEVTVVVDGYLYQKHPRFHDLMYSKTQELVNPGLKRSDNKPGPQMYP